MLLLYLNKSNDTIKLNKILQLKEQTLLTKIFIFQTNY